MKTRVLSILLALALCVSMLPLGALTTVAVNNTTEPCPHHPEHTEECGFIEAEPESPCMHVHDENCGYTETEEETGACTHEHDEYCGYAEAIDGHPCDFVCPICTGEEDETDEADGPEQWTVTRWTWVDDWDALLPASDYDWVEGVDWVLGVTDLDEDGLRMVLPSSVIAAVDTGDLIELDITWDFNNPQEYFMDGEALADHYLFTASLPAGFTLGAGVSSLSVLVNSQSISLLWVPAPSADPDQMTGAQHFIVRHWHTDETAKGTFGQEGSSSDKWYFVVAEGYIVPKATAEDLGYPTIDKGNYEFYLVAQSDTPYSGDDDYTSTGILEAGKLALITEASDSLYIADLNWNTGTITLKSRDDSDDSFAGYSVSAGHGAVTVAENTITITYDKYVHLVKAHAFYTDDIETKLGSNKQEVVGYDGLFDPEKDTAWVYLDSDHNFITYENKVIKKSDVDAEAAAAAKAEAEGEDYETPLKDKVGNTEPTKVYSTTEGLHTDKTALAVDPETGKSTTEAVETRTFDIELESWYTEGYAPQVGFVLDASFSMAYASDEPEKIKLTTEEIEALNINQVKSNPNNNWDTYFLDDNILAKILDPNKTDNSTLGAGDYNYFVFNGSDYAPLGYWEGYNAETFKPIAQLLFENKTDLPLIPDKQDPPVERSWLYDNITNQHAKRVNQVNLSESSYEFQEKEVEDWRTGDLKFSTGNGLQVASTGNNSGVLLDKTPSGGNFTLAFELIYNPDNVSGDKLVETLYIGPMASTDSSGYFRLYCDMETGQLYGSQASDADGTLESSVKLTKNSSKQKVALVFQNANTGNGTVTLYIAGKNAGTGNLTKPITKANIILAGVEDSYSGGNDDLCIDTLTLYDRIMTPAQIDNGGTDYPTVATTADGSKVLGSINLSGSYYTETNGSTLTTATLHYTQPGWYYITGAGDYTRHYAPLGTAKRLIGIDGTNNKIAKTFTTTEGYTYTQSTDTPARFYVDDEGYLCVFICSSPSSADSIKYAISSYVYELTDGEYVRTETLRRAMGAFLTELGEKSPSSRTSAVRFSHNTIPLENLVLLDWTSALSTSLGALSLKWGDGGATTYTTSSANGYDLKQYNYGLTGGTYTQSGLQAFIENLVKDENDNYRDDPTDADKRDDVPKFLIVFTDGKDDDVENPNNGAFTYANQLKNNYGYTIFTVLLDGGTMSTDDYDHAEAFLKKLSGAKDTEEKDKGNYFFSVKKAKEKLADEDMTEEEIANTSDADILTEIFSRDILDKIVDPLKDFTVTDYIDPRFDLVDRHGNTIKLKADGEVEMPEYDEAGEVAGEEVITVTVPDEGVKIPIDRSSVKAARMATLHYSTEKDMYYLEWEGQEIPTSAIGADSLTVWNAKFRITAKEDFIGGNAILTNANEAKMNWVYNPNDADASSGTDDRIKGEDGEDDQPSKGFPRTSVNVTPPTETLDETQIIYMGEELRASDITQKLVEAAANDTSNTETGAQYYWEYLKRFCDFFSHYKETDPVSGKYTKLGDLVTKLVDGELKDGATGDSASDYISLGLHVMNRSGGFLSPEEEDSTELGHIKIISNRIHAMIETDLLTPQNLSKLLLGEAVEGLNNNQPIGDHIKYLYLPYIYLPDDLKNPSTNTGYGKENAQVHLGDVIGYLEFEIVECVEENGKKYPAYPTENEKYITTDTQTRKSALSVTFKVQSPTERQAWNNSRVIRELKNADGDLYDRNNKVYARDHSYKPAAGEPATEQVIEGTLTTEIVSGEVQLQVKIDETLLNDVVGKNLNYTAELVREDPNGTKVPVGTLTINATIEADKKLYTATFKPADAYDYTAYDDSGYGLPLGTYTLANGSGEVKSGNEVLKNYNFGEITVVKNTSEYKTPEVFVKGSDVGQNGWEEKYQANLTDTSAGLGDKTAAGKTYTDLRFGLFRVDLEEVGDLKIEKVVSSVAADCTQHHLTSDEFEFTVTLYTDYTDETNNTVAADENRTFTTKTTTGTDPSTVTFTNGVATVKLKHGETLTIENLPTKYYYTVEEESKDGYILKTKTGDSGQITSDSTRTAHAAFTNQAVHTLKVEKLVAGKDADYNDTWEFTVTLTLPDGVELPEGNHGLTLTKGEGNTYTGTFTLGNNGSATITGLPCGTKYTVTEVKANQDGYGTTIKNSVDGKITAGGVFSSDQLIKNTTLTYTNRNPKGGVSIHKNVVDAIGSDDEKFTFTVKITGVPADAEWDSSKILYYLAGSDVGITLPLKEDPSGTYTGTLELADTQEAHIEGIPVGATVEVTENTPTYFTATWDNKYFDYTAQDDPEGTPISGQSVQVTNEDILYSFNCTNTRKTSDLTLEKKVTGNMGNREEKFKFTVTLTDENNKPLTGNYSFTGPDGKTINFVEGVATVWLADKEKITIEGLPEGAKYTIVEDDDRYTTTITGADQTSGKTASGTIGEGDGKITYENNLTATIPTNATTQYGWLIPIFLLISGGAALLLIKRLKVQRYQPSHYRPSKRSRSP